MEHMGRMVGRSRDDDPGHHRYPVDTSPETILVVEDESALLQVVSLLLEDSGYRVLQATSGETALSVLREITPHLILSDVMMPGMGGVAFYARVRQDPRWSQIPFVFLTAQGQRSDIRRGMELGADDYLTKPFEPEELLAAVRARLTRAASTKTAIDEASSGLRDTIMRLLGHELRTPLTLVMGYGELLEETVRSLSDDDSAKLLSGLREGSHRLAHLVEDVLLLSKLESGLLTDHWAAHPQAMAEPDDWVAHVLEGFEDRAAARNVSLALNRGAPGAAIVASRQYVSEIVRRLVDNAIKFSRKEGGRVVLTTHLNGDFWVLDVVDDGVGIRPDALDWILDTFRQVDRDQMEQQGAGLGLAIVRGLAELLGGRVMVESEPDIGSRFTVCLLRAGQSS
jgi:signal transduction histidine kinase